MGPLDLEKQFPRSPREKLAGLYFMPRTIDKLRAEQPGGKMGVYLNEADGLSAWICKRAGIDMEAFRAKVAEANDDADVEAWLREQLDPAKVEELNAKIEGLGPYRLAPEYLEIVKRNHPIMNDRPDLKTYFEIMDVDEARVTR
ncbi:MAG TPA: DUF5069 domain-containing protein [Candidatus Elarobacter sp.]